MMGFIELRKGTKEYELDKKLKEFAEKITITNEEMRQVLEMLEQVRLLVSTKEVKDACEIDRILITGIFGKKASAGKKDIYIDVVFFMKVEEAIDETFVLKNIGTAHKFPNADFRLGVFNFVLEAWKNILTKPSGVDLGISDVKQTKFSIEFNIPYEFETSGLLHVDVLPAINFSSDIEKQQSETIAKIEYFFKTYPTDFGTQFVHIFSSSLAEKHVAFMQNQNNFTKDLVVLCKYWWKNSVKKQISGGSNLVDIIAIAARQAAEEKCDEKFKDRIFAMQYFKAFRIFLQYMINLDEIGIDFGKVGKAIIKKKPFVIQPNNGFHNLIKSLDSSEIKTIKDVALKTMGHFETIQLAKSMDDILSNK